MIFEKIKKWLALPDKNLNKLATVKISNIKVVGGVCETDGQEFIEILFKLTKNFSFFLQSHVSFEFLPLKMYFYS